MVRRVGGGVNLAGRRTALDTRENEERIVRVKPEKED